MLHINETDLTNSTPVVAANPLKVGAITYKSIRHAARTVAKKTGESENTVYGRIYQRMNSGLPLAQAMSVKPLKKGKKGNDVEFGGKTYESLSDAIKAWAKKNRKPLTDEEYNTIYARTLNRKRSGMAFDEAISSDDLRGTANGKPIQVGDNTYPSLMEAIRSNVTGEVNQAMYIRFVNGLKSGKSFKEILEAPVRQYKLHAPTHAEKIANDYEDMTEMYETVMAQAEESQMGQAA